MENNSQVRKAKNAFTLIEIMIVVLIIGVLLGIAVPNFVRAREASRAKACVANLKALDGAYQQWMMDNKLPATNPPPAVSTLVGGNYLKSTPKCPSGGDYAAEFGSGPPDPRKGAGAYYCSTSSEPALGDPLAHRL